MPTSVSVATAIAWLLVLLWSFAAAGPHGAIAFDTPSALIGDAIVLMIISVIAGSLYFAHSPRRWLAVLLLVSIIPALVFPCSLWTDISLSRTFGLNYIDAVLFGPAVCGLVVYITLALLWARICWRFRDIAIKT